MQPVQVVLHVIVEPVKVYPGLGEVHPVIVQVAQFRGQAITCVLSAEM